MEQTKPPKCQALDRWLDRIDAGNFLRPKLRFEGDANCLVDDADQGFLSLGPPKNAFRVVGSVEEQVFWFPDGVPIGTSVLLASSRIGLQPETKSGIFDALRTVACRFDSNQHFLITHTGLATHRYVLRAADLFDIPLMVFRPMPADINSNWFQDILNSRKRKWACYYGTLHGGDANLESDGLMIALATEVRLLSVRSGGRILDATDRRLAAGESDGSTKTLLLMNRSLTNSKLTKQLMDGGVLPWWLYRDTPEENQGTQHWSQRVIGLREFASRNQLGDYLIHWTRRRTGPWPDQTESQFLDDLILGLPSSDHSRIAALSRIVATKQLLANNEITRDSTPVVCFSECTVDELSTRRQFRSHLNRWDFETVGIAVKRDVLVDRGAQPVFYGDDATWKQMPAAKRPYFQMAQSETPSGNLDWTGECEWRVIGNLDLSRIAATDAFVYVETAEEAVAVARFSRWPVIVLAASIEN